MLANDYDKLWTRYDLQESTYYLYDQWDWTSDVRYTYLYSDTWVTYTVNNKQLIFFNFGFVLLTSYVVTNVFNRSQQER